MIHLRKKTFLVYLIIGSFNLGIVKPYIILKLLERRLITTNAWVSKSNLQNYFNQQTRNNDKKAMIN